MSTTLDEAKRRASNYMKLKGALEPIKNSEDSEPIKNSEDSKPMKYFFVSYKYMEVGGNWKDDTTQLKNEQYPTIKDVRQAVYMLEREEQKECLYLTITSLSEINKEWYEVLINE